ncbi:PLP-dependent aminotransferase family protein [Chloroflexales bacterium ZM16-3]|nr:PLP-dependent aminotransferase family protein [Chloroflexales bacterium ZM16-3]
MLPDVQIIQRPGIVEFGWGHPAPELLPAEALARAAALTLGGDWHAALTYGYGQEPGRLIELIRLRLGRLEGVTPPAEQLMITAGISQALDMLCAQLSRPGDVVLVEAPTYHLALRIFRDRGLRAVAVPGDGQGIHVDAAEAMLHMLRSGGERVAFLYTVASFGNPSGATLTAERRYALAALARRESLMVIEDDVYGELWYDAPPPPPIYNLAPGGPIVRVGSYSKVLAPGLRLGWMLAAPDLVRRCSSCGVLDSGGGVSHFTAHMVAAFLELGLLDPHVEGLRAALRSRRNVMLTALSRHMPSGCTWNPSLGGFFIWVRLPTDTDSAALLPAAEAAGVGYLPGERFFAEGGGQNYLRLCFSLLPPDEIAEGVRRLGAALRRG